MRYEFVKKGCRGTKTLENSDGESRPLCRPTWGRPQCLDFFSRNGRREAKIKYRQWKIWFWLFLWETCNSYQIRQIRMKCGDRNSLGAECTDDLIHRSYKKNIEKNPFDVESEQRFFCSSNKRTANWCSTFSEERRWDMYLFVHFRRKIKWIENIKYNKKKMLCQSNVGKKWVSADLDFFLATYVNVIATTPTRCLPNLSDFGSMYKYSMLGSIIRESNFDSSNADQKWPKARKTRRGGGEYIHPNISVWHSYSVVTWQRVTCDLSGDSHQALA